MAGRPNGAARRAGTPKGAACTSGAAWTTGAAGTTGSTKPSWSKSSENPSKSIGAGPRGVATKFPTKGVNGPLGAPMAAATKADTVTYS